MVISSWPISKRTLTALEKNKILTLDDLPEYLDDLKAIEGLGPKGVLEIREWALTKFKRKFKSRPKEKKKVLKNFKESREVLEHLIPGPKNWPKQLKLADQLVEKYTHELLMKVTPNPKVYSLVWYLAEYGDKYIRQFMIGKVIKEEPKVEEVVAPCELNIQATKPKSLGDFMKL